MSVYKNQKTGNWYAIFRYTDWQGKRKQKKKEGFKTKKEAQIYEREFLLKETSTPEMSFNSLVELYIEDVKTRIRKNTYEIKEAIIRTKVLPYFKDKQINNITPADVRRWQNELISQNYSQTYIKTIHNQLSAIFNYAIRYHNLSKNPAKEAGSVGKKKADRVSFWTAEEFNKAIKYINEYDYVSKISLEILFWTGMRQGELYALTPQDINFKNNTISISKSLVVLSNGEININKTKTETSERIVEIPNFLINEIKEFMNRYVEPLKPNERIFKTTKSNLSRKINSIAKKAEIKKIRVHDLRHSHASMLIDLGFSPLMVKERLGHQNIETTLETYSHLYQTKNQELMNKLENLYNKI